LSRIFDVAGASTYLASISGMKLTNGQVDVLDNNSDAGRFDGSGGAIRFDIQSLNLTDTALINNTAAQAGGAIEGNYYKVYLTSGGATNITVTLDNCV